SLFAFRSGRISPRRAISSDRRRLGSVEPHQRNTSRNFGTQQGPQGFDHIRWRAYFDSRGGGCSDIGSNSVSQPRYRRRPSVRHYRKSPGICRSTWKSSIATGGQHGHGCYREQSRSTRYSIIAAPDEVPERVEGLDVRERVSPLPPP